jgi:hypothetical protein
MGYTIPFTAVRTAWEANVAAFGAPATWTQAGVPLALSVGYGIARGTDVAIANALGVGVRIITVRAIDTAGGAPHPLDRIDVAGETLTIDDVQPVVLIGELVGWRCQCAGSRPGP